MIERLSLLAECVLTQQTITNLIVMENLSCVDVSSNNGLSSWTKRTIVKILN